MLEKDEEAITMFHEMVVNGIASFPHAAYLFQSIYVCWPAWKVLPYAPSHIGKQVKNGS